MPEDKQVLTRAEVDQQLTWDLTPLARSNADFHQKLTQVQQKVVAFAKKYKQPELSVPELKNALADYNALTEAAETLITYSSLLSSTDFTNAENSQIAYEGSQFYVSMRASLQFFEDALLQLDDSTFQQLVEASPEFTGFLRQLKHYQQIALDPKVEHALALLGPTFSAPENTYEAMQTATCTSMIFWLMARNTPYPLACMKTIMPTMRTQQFGALPLLLSQKNWHDTRT